MEGCIDKLGATEGIELGSLLNDGMLLGELLGAIDKDGIDDGFRLGIIVGVVDGSNERLGCELGLDVGASVGIALGAIVIWFPPPHTQHASLTAFPWY